MDSTDQAVLAVIATAFLIREGGKVMMSQDEWQQAIDHESTLYVLKPKVDEGEVMLVLLPKGKSESH